MLLLWVPAAAIAIPLIIGAAIYVPWIIIRRRRAHPLIFAFAAACIAWIVSNSVLGALIVIGVAFQFARADQGRASE